MNQKGKWEPFEKAGGREREGLTSWLTCPGHAICLSESVYRSGPVHKHTGMNRKFGRGRKKCVHICLYERRKSWGLLWKQRWHQH